MARFSVSSAAERVSFSKVRVLVQRSMTLAPCPRVVETGRAADAIRPVTKGRVIRSRTGRTRERTVKVTSNMSISKNYSRIRRDIPDDVTIVVSCKTRSAEEIKEVIDAGATDIGENYVQEAGQMYSALRKDAAKVRWHMIGSLQTNKINKALGIFDAIQTIDSLPKAVAIDTRAETTRRSRVPIYVEINIGSEDSKAGIKPAEHEPFDEYIQDFIKAVSRLAHISLEGLMTMGPRFGNPEHVRPYFRRTKKLFDTIKKLRLPNIDMKYLSMGMTNSYRIAIEEGSNMVRIGTAVFGARKPK
jgi:pyridoxal phosphate enzyme (YggS family)